MADFETILWTTTGAAAVAAPRACLEPKALDLLKSELSPRQFAEALLAADFAPDAMKLISFAFPRREVMWWAAQCIKSVPGLLDPPGATAIAAVELWCAKPTDENRRAAYSLAEATGSNTPAGLAAMAVFLCEGSLSPPEFEKVSAPAEVGLSMAGNAALLAALVKDPDQSPQHFAKFLELANAVAAGTNRWNEEKAAPKATASPQSTGAKEFPPYPQPKGRKL